ncbi:hypothetical protein H6G27_02595 [Nostoc linckia FACHB-104]|nr:hypothetical protein [Nostoc linckia FACHB-104]
MSDYSTSNGIQSSFDGFGDEDDSAKGKQLLAWLGTVDFFGADVPLGADKARFSDPKAGNNSSRARKLAKGYIEGAKDKAFAFWQVFEAVYSSNIEQDAWAGTAYYEGKSTTVGRLVARLEKVLEMARPRTSEGFYDRQLEMLLEDKKFQPVKRYLDNCKKQFTVRVPDDDGEMRYQEGAFGTPLLTPLPEWDSLGQVLFGTDDSLTQEMITTWLCGAVKRALDPGCYMKRALILKGDQDAGKSAFVNKLAKFWGTELPSGTSDMDFIRLCTRTWIMELAECDRLFKGKEASILKQQLSTTVDKYTPKYKEADEMSVTPRVTVFIGTTNKAQFLVDDTGNKRFWVIDMADGWKLPLAWLDENIDQLWATAYHKLMAGHPTDLSPASQVASEVRNNDYMVEGSWNEQIESTLDKATFNGKHSIAFQLVDLMTAMGIRYENQGKNKAAILTSLKQLGYEQKAFFPLGKTTKLYHKPSGDKPTPAKFDPERFTWVYLDTEKKAYI